MEDGDPEIGVFYRRAGVSREGGRIPAVLDQLERSAQRIELNWSHRDFELRSVPLHDEASNAVGVGVNDETHELAEVSAVVSANAYVGESERSGFNAAG